MPGRRQLRASTNIERSSKIRRARKLAPLRKSDGTLHSSRPCSSAPKVGRNLLRRRVVRAGKWRLLQRVRELSGAPYSWIADMLSMGPPRPFASRSGVRVTCNRQAPWRLARTNSGTHECPDHAPGSPPLFCRPRCARHTPAAPTIKAQRVEACFVSYHSGSKIEPTRASRFRLMLTSTGLPRTADQLTKHGRHRWTGRSTH